jgi:hypothetical protein
VPVFEVDRILDHRKIGRNKRIQYLILWKGYPISEATWEPIENLDGALDSVIEYNQKKNIDLEVVTVISSMTTVNNDSNNNQIRKNMWNQFQMGMGYWNMNKN